MGAHAFGTDSARRASGCLVGTALGANTAEQCQDGAALGCYAGPCAKGGFPLITLARGSPLLPLYWTERNSAQLWWLLSLRTSPGPGGSSRPLPVSLVPAHLWDLHFHSPPLPGAGGHRVPASTQCLDHVCWQDSHMKKSAKPAFPHLHSYTSISKQISSDKGHAADSSHGSLFSNYICWPDFIISFCISFPYGMMELLHQDPIQSTLK